MQISGAALWSRHFAEYCTGRAQRIISIPGLAMSAVVRAMHEDRQQKAIEIINDHFSKCSEEELARYGLDRGDHRALIKSRLKN
jgi:hypothetical protein